MRISQTNAIAYHYVSLIQQARTQFLLLQIISELAYDRRVTNGPF